MNIYTLLIKIKRNSMQTIVHQLHFYKYYKNNLILIKTNNISNYIIPYDFLITDLLHYL